MKVLSLITLACGVGLTLGAHAEAPSFSRHSNPPTVTSGGIAFELPDTIQTISQSTSTTVTAGGAVSCNGGAPNFRHTDNSYYRGMTLSAFPALTLPQFVVQQVNIGVEQATGTSGSQPITVRIWDATANPINGAPNPPGNTQVSSQAVTVTNQNLTLLPVTLTTQPLLLVASDILAVEVFTPNGSVPGNTFFIGANAGGQAGPSYLKAADCGVANITDTAGIGFPNMHIVMQVTGNNQTPVELQTISID